MSVNKHTPAPLPLADLEREVELRLGDTETTESSMISAVRILAKEVVYLRGEVESLRALAGVYPEGGRPKDGYARQAPTSDKIQQAF